MIEDEEMRMMQTIGKVDDMKKDCRDCMYFEIAYGTHNNPYDESGCGCPKKKIDLTNRNTQDVAINCDAFECIGDLLN